MTTATIGADGRHHRATPPGRSSRRGTGVPRATRGRPGPGPHVLGVVSADRHVSQFASWPGPLAIQVDVGALDGQAAGQQGGRVLAGGAAEDVDAGHLGCAGAVEPRGRSSTARRWFSNCEVTAPSIVQCPELCGRVATSLTSRRPPDQKSSTAMTPDGAGDARPPAGPGRPPRRPRRGSRPGTRTSRQTPPTCAVSTAGQATDSPEGRRATMDGQLGLERHQLLHHDPAGDVGQHGLGLGLVLHRPDALAVVAAAGGLEHDRPAVGRGELGHGLGGVGPRLEHGVGGHRDAGLVEHGAHVGLVDGELQGGRAGPHAVPSATSRPAGRGRPARGRRSPRRSARPGRAGRPRRRGEPTMTSAATAQAASSARSASTAMERPSALAASPAMRASWPAPTNPTSWVLSSLASAAGFA